MFRKIDPSIVWTTGLLSLLGIMMIFSTAGYSIMTRQIIWLIFSFVVALLFSRISPRIWLNISPAIYTVAVLLTLAILFKGDVYPRRWIRIGDVSIQPSEFTKFATVLMLAYYLAGKKRLSNFSDMVVPTLIAGVPALLVFLEPDLGAAQIFLPILIVMSYWAGMPGWKILILFSPIISAIASFSIYAWVAYMVILMIFLYFRRQLTDLVYGFVSNTLMGLIMPLVWNSLKIYQQKRILSFFSPWIDPRGMSWQIIQSKIAIGSGGIFGKGFLSGTQKKLEFLPERHTDFIFSCLGEEFGLFGIIIVLTLYVYLMYRLLTLAKETRNRFSSILVSGFMTWIAYQTFINIGVTMGLLPVTGVPLPFISYGGSALLSCFMAIGICLSISRVKMSY
ncbi:MAG: rod shape-determining protein RodA [candidate division WOR-3 bacterium]|nr:MAG: rod shape-determining protein RodA [candidate division WOR-3 bacterium]